MKSQFLRVCPWSILGLLLPFVLGCGIIEPNDIKTLTIKPDGAAGKDAQVASGYPTMNYGDSNPLQVGASTLSGWDGIVRSYLQFNLSSIPSDASVVVAALWLTHEGESDAPASVTICAHKVTGSWNESTITWNNQPTSDPTCESTITIPAGDPGGWRKWFIRELVQGWIDGSIPNYGVVLKQTDESTITTWKYFRSSDFPSTSTRPKLEVQYTLPPS